MNTNTATCGGGLVAGTTFDTCLYRAAAKVWTFNADTSLRVPGYGCVGCTSAPANTIAGDQSGNRLFLGPITASVADRFGNLYVRRVRSLSAATTDYITVADASTLLEPGSGSSIIVDQHLAQTMVATGSAVTGISYHANQRVVNFGGPLSLSEFRGENIVSSFLANFTGSITTYYWFSEAWTVNSGAAGTITNYHPYMAPAGPTGGVTATNVAPYYCSGTMRGTSTNTCFRTKEQTGGSNNAAFWIDSNTASCGAGLVAGAGLDTCLYRGRAGAWTGPAGTDIYTDSGYICAGTGCSAVTSTNTGVYDAGVRVMSSVSCTGASCSLTNGALSVTVTGTTSATVSASITGGGSCGGSVSVLGSWSNMRVTLITGTGPGCSVPGDDVFQVVRGTACGSSGVPVCNISPGDDVSPPLTWNGPSGSGTTRIARTPSYGSTLSVSTTYYYDIRCGCTTD